MKIMKFFANTLRLGDGYGVSSKMLNGKPKVMLYITKGPGKEPAKLAGVRLDKESIVYLIECLQKSLDIYYSE